MYVEGPIVVGSFIVVLVFRIFWRALLPEVQHLRVSTDEEDLKLLIEVLYLCADAKANSFVRPYQRSWAWSFRFRFSLLFREVSDE